jgi:hypothetical protein
MTVTSPEIARPSARARAPAEPSASPFTRPCLRRVPIDCGLHLSDATHARSLAQPHHGTAHAAARHADAR